MNKNMSFFLFLIIPSLSLAAAGACLIVRRFLRFQHKARLTMGCSSLQDEGKADLNQQTEILLGPERIHVSVLSPASRNIYKKRYHSAWDDVATMYDALRRGMKQSNNGPCLGWRPSEADGYHWLSYSTVISRAVSFGRGLRQLGLKAGDFVGIYSKNRVEWVLAEQGIFSFSMISVALYDTLGLEACQYIIEQAQLSLIVVEDEAKLLLLLKGLPPCVKTIVHLEDLPPHTKGQVRNNEVELFSFEDVEKLGVTHRDSFQEEPPRADDVATLNYTSGTLGDPKGVVVAHKNLIASASGSFSVSEQMPIPPHSKDVAISFLPLAHIYERMLHVLYFANGLSVGFYRGDVLKLMDDLRLLRPTIFPCVPRLLNRVHDKIMSGASDSKLKTSLLKHALRQKGKEVDKGILRKDSIWDYLVFRKVQQALGGRVRVVISGGAPINGEIIRFFRTALGCCVFEGYGQTESSGCLTLTLPHEVTADHIGAPTTACAVKLVDVPEMNYFARDGAGEVCIKGPLVCSGGYYKKPEMTAETFDCDGWLHSGDIGKWLPNGTLKIIDRKKNIFKLSQGEYVAPEKIENIYACCPLVSQVFVYGNSLESYLVGVVVPDAEALKREYSQEFWTSSAETQVIRRLCRKPDVAMKILAQITKHGFGAGLKSFEQVKALHLHPDSFSVENGLLTPTLKSKRADLKAFFDKEIQRLYEQGPTPVKRN